MIQSNTITTNHSLQQFSFSYGNNEETFNITEPLINNEINATKRATTEFIKHGMKTQSVTFTTYFTDLHINDIIALKVPEKRIPRELNKDRFIVKKVTHAINTDTITTILEVERYD